MFSVLIEGIKSTFILKNIFSCRPNMKTAPVLVHQSCSTASHVFYHHKEKCCRNLTMTQSDHFKIGPLGLFGHKTLSKYTAFVLQHTHAHKNNEFLKYEDTQVMNNVFFTFLGCHTQKRSKEKRRSFMRLETILCW